MQLPNIHTGLLVFLLDWRLDLSIGHDQDTIALVEVGKEKEEKEIWTREEKEKEQGQKERKVRKSKDQNTHKYHHDGRRTRKTFAAGFNTIHPLPHLPLHRLNSRNPIYSSRKPNQSSPSRPQLCLRLLRIRPRDRIHRYQTHNYRRDTQLHRNRQ